MFRRLIVFINAMCVRNIYVGTSSCFHKADIPRLRCGDPYFSLTRPLLRRDSVLFKPPEIARGGNLTDLKPRGLSFVIRALEVITQQLTKASPLTLTAFIHVTRHDLAGNYFSLLL